MAAANTITNNKLLSYHLNRLKSSPKQSLLLDGGTGEELFLHGVPDDRKIWSATAIVHEKYHDTVEKVHRSFIEAGSQAITTNSYGIVPGVGFKDAEEVIRLNNISGEIARRAVTDEDGTVSALVLGSLGPLVESYRADLIMKHEDGVRCYLYAIEGLNPHVDIYLAETMSCTEEACQVVDALDAFYRSKTESHKQPLLISFTLSNDGKLRSGECIADAISKIVDFAADKKVEREYCDIQIKPRFNRMSLSLMNFITLIVIGVLINCCEPETITVAIKEIVSTPQIYQYLHHPPPHASTLVHKTHVAKIFIGAYANKLMAVDQNWTMATSTEAQQMRDDLFPDRYWEFVKSWNDGYGVQLIGGCCGIGPAHISCLKKNLVLSDSSSKKINKIIT